MSVKSQVKQLLEELNKGVYEKEEVTALTLLAAIAGESIFLLGAPGVAKSLVARRLKFAFEGGSSFEYLMNRFSTPDEIFGPVSISKLKDEDKYERIVKNYLPSATVVFLDEVWKAGPSIQNALLTVLNEKIYRNGDKEIHVPMKALIAASNELPMKGEGLEALWDRFLVRYIVGGVEDRNNFNEMISKTLKNYEDNVSPAFKFTDEQYVSISEAIDKVSIPKDVFNIIHVIRLKIQAYNKVKENAGNEIYISDRRWRKIIRLLRTAAYLNERESVDMMDCFLITHCIWHDPEHYKIVSDILKDAIQHHGCVMDMNLKDIQEELAEFNEDVIEGCKFVKKIKFTEPELYYDKYYKILGANFDVSYNGTYDLISKLEYNKLRDNPHWVYIYCDTGNGTEAEKPKKYQLTKGSKEGTIGYEDELLKILYVTRERGDTFTRRPPAALEKKFSERLNVVLTTTENMKKKLEKFRLKDLDHLRVNLFVDPAYASIVETSWNNARIEIEKLEVEANRIQHFWENIEDQTGLDFDTILGKELL
jgi:MoxR-like ATPase